MINVSDNSAEVIDFLGRYAQQARFATALALSTTVKDIQDAMPAKLEADLDKPTPFTKKAFATERATPQALRAAVYIRPLQAAYLRYQVVGGARSPSKVALRLPSVVSLNQYGNLPTGTIRQLIARAKAGMRATRKQAGRYGVSSAVDLFYGDPGDGRPAGLYKRVVISPTRHQLVPIVVMPKQAAQYRRRFDFYGHARKVAGQRWPANVSAALARALSTAKR